MNWLSPIGSGPTRCGLWLSVIQFRQPVAAAGAAEEDRQLVADEFPAAAGEDRLIKHARY
jgi:hypothetical protein